MTVVATGFIVRQDPNGFSVTAWHRHAVGERKSCETETFDHLVRGEMLDVLFSYIDAYQPGDLCRETIGYQQVLDWADARGPERT